MITHNHLPPGFHARPMTEDDIPALCAMLNTCAIAEIGAPDQDENDIRSYLDMPGFSVESDTRIVLAPGGAFAGYAEFWNIQEPKVRPFLWARVHPDFRGQSIGTYLLRWAEQRSARVIEAAPQGARVSLRGSTISTNMPAQDLFRNEGYFEVRSFYRMLIEMETPPPDPTWPDGITVRIVENTREAMHAAFVANEEAFQDHWGFLPISFDTWWHWIQNDAAFDPSLLFVALDGETIAGTCFCRFKTNEDPAMGWVDDLGVRRPWRRQGIALALLHHAFGELYRRGQRKVGLGVDAQSLTGATRLYEKAGMFVARQYVSFEKELRPGEELSTQAIEQAEATP
jgi:mycothiol synthase